jgi:glucokinase
MRPCWKNGADGIRIFSAVQETMSNSLAIGIDLGATKIAAALVQRDGQVIVSRQVSTDATAGFEAVLNRMAEQIELLLVEAPGPIVGIGIGSPGQIDLSSGVVRDAVNLGWTTVPLISSLQIRLKTALPIWVQKDTNAGALGEYFFGAARDCPNFVHLTIGSGLGSGAMVNGQLIDGATNGSDLGHWAIDPVQGRWCSCGLRGCAETVVSGPGLLTVAREVGQAQAARSGWWDQSDLTTSAVIEAARAHDPVAQAAFDRMAEWLGMIMAACIAVLNPAKFVLGGGLGLAAFEWLISGAEREVRRRVLPKGYAQVALVRSELESSAVGAACLAWSKQRPANSV